MRVIYSIAAFLTAAASLLAAPPTDAEVEAAVRTFADKDRAAAAAETPPKQSERIAWADAALATLDVPALTQAQIYRLVRGRVLPLSSRSGAIADRLASAARADSVDAAEAAALRVNFLALEPDASAQVQVYRRALTHPKLGDALKQGRAVSLLFQLPGTPRVLLPELQGLNKVFTTDMPPEVAARAHLAVDAVVAIAGDDAVAAREPLRAKVLEMVRNASKQQVSDPAIRKALDESEKKLDGAFMKGTLIGAPAPLLSFVWCSVEPAVQSVTSLKGRIVVLDFWATWCGPCVASFPDTRKLQAYYDRYPVIILGVTSPQGFHVAGPKLDQAGKHTGETRSIDCANDPHREMELMGEYVAENNITWPIVFSEESVYNSVYGVSEIPHMIIIDAKGIVRHRKLHSSNLQTPFAEKVEKINALLKEAGYPAPPNVK